MVEPVRLVTGILAIVPAGALFFVAYGRYDGLFHDRIVFLHFIGGLLLGAFLAVFALIAGVAVPRGLQRTALFVLLTPLLYAIAPAAILNRRKWQGDAHSVFNGGALGLGVATMTTFAFAFKALEGGLDWVLVGAWTAMSLALAGAAFAVGLLLGAGVAARRPFRAAFAAAALNVVTFEVLNEYLQSRALLWPAIAVALGLAAFGVALARVMPRGVTDEAWRHRRRRRRTSA